MPDPFPNFLHLITVWLFSTDPSTCNLLTFLSGGNSSTNPLFWATGGTVRYTTIGDWSPLPTISHTTFVLEVQLSVKFLPRATS